MIPIGEGYYSIQFSCVEDRERVFSRRTWQLKLGLLRLQRWVPDFNPYRVTTSVVQVWIHISELPLEYWNKYIISALASAVGTVIKIDDRTLNKSMGRFARVLVELDLKQERKEYLMFERAGHCSFVGVQYERLPEFCKFCNVIGHTTGHCGGNNNRQRNGKPNPTTQKGDDPKDTSTAPLDGTKQWVQKTFPSAANGDKLDKIRDTNQGTPPGPQCHNSFAVLEEIIDGDTDMIDSETTKDAAEADESTTGVVTISSKNQLQVHLPPIEEDNTHSSLPLPTAGEVDVEDLPKGRKQKSPYNDKRI
ncbi:hypothetical protein ACS0TY_022040 [Phlomoides rotata]